MQAKMKSKKIVVTGGTGLIGKQLCKALLNKGYYVVLLSRNPSSAKKILPEVHEIHYWNDYENKSYSEFLEGAFGVVHLGGANIAAKKWTSKYKDEIYKSREISTRILVNSISALKEKPEVFVSSSAVGIYGNRGEEILTEDSSLGSDFLSEVCKVWEDEASKVEKLNVRCVKVRTGIVLSKDGGALKKMITPFKWFIGGPLGDGKQGMSWIHITDIVNLFLFAIENKEVNGVLNGTAPNYVSMGVFAKILGKIMHRPSIFKVPEFVLILLLGEGADAVLSSQFVYPKQAIQFGYKFQYPTLEAALLSLFKK